MSATTIAVAVTHDTVAADRPPEAELAMNELSSPRGRIHEARITVRNSLKFKKPFAF
jgi:hypothetical protein